LNRAIIRTSTSFWCAGVWNAWPSFCGAGHSLSRSPTTGVWRVAFAFDPKRNAVLPIAGDKSGGGEKKFYRRLIAKADERFDEHLSRMKKKGK
jgi:hypothetical protein